MIVYIILAALLALLIFTLPPFYAKYRKKFKQWWDKLKQLFRKYFPIILLSSFSAMAIFSDVNSLFGDPKTWGIPNILRQVVIGLIILGVAFAVFFSLKNIISDHKKAEKKNEEFLNEIEGRTLDRIALFLHENKGKYLPKLQPPNPAYIKDRTFQMLVWASYNEFCLNVMSPQLKSLGIHLNTVHYWNGQVDEFIPTYEYRVRGLYDNSHEYLDGIIFDCEMLDELRAPDYLLKYSRSLIKKAKEKPENEEYAMKLGVLAVFSALRSKRGEEICTYYYKNKKGQKEQHCACRLCEGQKKDGQFLHKKTKGVFLLPLQWFQLFEGKRDNELTGHLIKQMIASTLPVLEKRKDKRRLEVNRLDSLKLEAYGGVFKERNSDDARKISDMENFCKRPEDSDFTLMLHPRLIPSTADERNSFTYHYNQDWPYDSEELIYGIPLRYGTNGKAIFNGTGKEKTAHVFLDWYFASILPFALMTHESKYREKPLSIKDVYAVLLEKRVEDLAAEKMEVKDVFLASTITEISPQIKRIKSEFETINIWTGGEWNSQSVDDKIDMIPLIDKCKGVFWQESYGITSDFLLHAVSSDTKLYEKMGGFLKEKKEVIHKLEVELSMLYSDSNRTEKKSDEEINGKLDEFIKDFIDYMAEPGREGFKIVNADQEILGRINDLWKTVGFWTLSTIFEELKQTDITKSNLYFSNYYTSRPVNLLGLKEGNRHFPKNSEYYKVSWKYGEWIDYQTYFLKWVDEIEYIEEIPLRCKPFRGIDESWRKAFEELFKNGKKFV